jgi:hypothetical protein
MKRIHIIPIDKPSRIRIGENGNLVIGLTQSATISKNDSYTNQHIYITSDEEVKDVRPHKGKWQLEKGLILNKFPDYLTDLSECKLIILTTDQDLINDGVQAIDDEFLEWFVDNPEQEYIPIKIEQEKKIDNNKERQMLIGLLDWMNKVAQDNPMALETDSEDIVEMYLREYYEK